ncbi:sugar phosphate isomerase/epimerase family protein [Acidipila rosea]|uniref:Sugar phosphate isomerase/epimerase n=1 Tax=Acidipila rosea TaxID=768535 RepID=A0A4R1LB87_9BACT|nr:sugar phosphate isomerase/epimerase [Acidipila rosea]TCK74173.1 sugar phosphate isomerase/epimerase [Acidipila rosea]
MINRRDFARLSAAALATGLRLPHAAAATSPVPYGVQLYSVRQLIANSLPAVLQGIRRIGYTQVELFWEVYSHPAKALRTVIKDAGLTVPSGLFHFDDLESRIDYAAELGLTYMVCPEIPRAYSATPEGMKRGGAEFNRIGERVRASGMHLAYHNGNPEFRPWAGTNVFAALMDNTDAKLVGLEIDCYWAIEGGQDVNAMLRKYHERVHLLHLKDRTAGATVSYTPETPPGHFTDVGKGTIDWPSILRQARSQGVRYFFIDQDGSSLPPMESLQVSFDYLKTLHV